MAPSFSHVFALYDFDEGDPAVGTLSAIYTPSLPEDVEDCALLAESWIKSEKKLSIRWPADYSSMVCSMVYEPKVRPPDSLLRFGKLISLSDDKDLLRKKALALSKEKRAVLATTTNKPPIARKSLQFEGDKELGANGTENSVTQPTDSSTGATSGAAKKRIADESNEELKLKIRKLESREKKHLAEIANLKCVVKEHEDELEKLSADNGEKENTIFDLKEKLEDYERELVEKPKDHEGSRALSPEQLVSLSKEITTGLATLNTLISAQQNRPAVQMTPPSSRPASASKEMMKLKGDILVEKSAVTSAVAAGKREGNNHRSLRSFIKVLLTSYWTDEELASFSLTGEACRSLEDAVPKDKFPENYTEALIHFTTKRWAEMYPGSSTFGELEVRSAITKNLTNAHVRVERKKAPKPATPTSNKKRAANANKKAQTTDNDDPAMNANAGIHQPLPKERSGSAQQDVDESSESDEHP